MLNMNRSLIVGLVLAIVVADGVWAQENDTMACMYEPCEMMEEYEVPPLPYAYDSLEPSIDEQTMKFHHDVHFAGYTRKMNNALKALAEANMMDGMSVESMLNNLDMIEMQNASLAKLFRNNAGGYLNHKMYFSTLSPEKQELSPDSGLAKAIDDKFGSFEAFQDAMTKNASSVFGSGWSQLVMDPSSGEVMIKSYANQDSPYLDGLYPLLGVDVWEHAYYLNYGPKRADYIGKWWDIINYKAVEEAFDKAMETSQ